MSIFARIAVSALPVLPAASAWAGESSVNLQTPVTQIASEIYNMHTLMLVICLVIFVAVFGVMFWSVFHHRKSKGAVAAHFHEKRAEIHGIRLSCEWVKKALQTAGLMRQVRRRGRSRI